MARHHRVPAVRGHLLELTGNNAAASGEMCRMLVAARRIGAAESVIASDVIDAIPVGLHAAD